MSHGYTPQNFDIVWCKFPYEVQSHSAGIEPGLKARPCLVVAREVMDNGDEFIYVAYGTTQLHKSNQFSLLIHPQQKGLAFQDAGLFQATAFFINKIAKLPFNKDYFPDVPAIHGRQSQTHCRVGLLNEIGKKDLSMVLEHMEAKGLDMNSIIFDASEPCEVPRTGSNG